MVVEYIRYSVPADRYDESSVQGGFREAPECLACEVSHGLKEPDNYVVRIEWSSLEEHEHGFRESARFGPFLAAVNPFFEQIEDYQRTAIASAA